MDVKVTQMSLRCHNESWIAGRSEVYFRCTTSDPTEDFRRWDYPGSLSKEGDYNIYNFTRTQVDMGNSEYPDASIILIYRQVEYLVNATYISWGQDYPFNNAYLEDYRKSCVFYTVFEKDGFPSQDQSVDVSSGPVANHFAAGKTVSVSYISADPPYMTGWFHYFKDTQDQYPCGLWNTNSCISFTLDSFKGPRRNY